MSPIYEDHRSKRYEPPVIDLENRNSSHTLIVELTGENKNVLEVGTSTGYISRILEGGILSPASRSTRRLASLPDSTAIR